ncbi:LOW QUALITY PROTEIN: prostaglandin D2 receptor-like [Narcine bancroftii]|uniref:LOW QUALITY PROTEIN: prostaglandin D2 receptor-like n=1 Tax=Narcine bancroftii TaxID=1343680 RepID=UPI0038317649
MVQCENSSTVHKDGHVMSSILLFSAGLIGNIIALLILYKHKMDTRRNVSVFYILVTGLVVTDLLGKCLISPVVFVSYATNRTLKALSSHNSLCDYFSFTTSFFGLASMFFLFAMGVECWLSINHPFFYQNHFTKRRVIIIFPAVYLGSLSICSMPFMGLGSTKQYCPGTWCFFNMAKDEKKSAFFSVLYATLMVILIAAVLVFNTTVAINLTKMYKQRQRSKSSLRGSRMKRFTHYEELDNLILLLLMNVIFLICSLPLTIRAYIGAFAPDNRDEDDLIALKFASVNSIVDPWVFIIFRTSVFRKLVFVCCKRFSTIMKLESVSPVEN